MFDLAIEINISKGQTFIIPRIQCSNKQIAIYITTAILQIQRDEYEEFEKEGDIEKINFFISKDKSEMKVESTLDKPNTTYVLSNVLSQIIRTI